MPNRRSPDAAMSPFEVRALRRVGDGLPDVIKPDHRDLLIRMQLAKVNASGLLELTEYGRRRLAAETSEAPGQPHALYEPTFSASGPDVLPTFCARRQDCGP